MPTTMVAAVKPAKMLIATASPTTAIQRGLAAAFRI